MHPIIEEICRARTVRHDVFRRWQRQLRDDLQPMLDELDQLRAEKTAATAAKKPRQAATV